MALPLLAAALPLVVFAWRAASRHGFIVFDDALIALRIHDVFSTHPPALGAGTSFGRIAIEAHANHPGPLPFYLLAPVYAASGFRPVGLIASLLVVNFACVVVVISVARRVGGRHLVVLWAAGVLLLERALGEDVFTRPFNPYLGVLPFTAALVAAWAALTVSRWYLLVAVALGSVAAQSQAAYAGPVAVLVGVTLVVLAGRVLSGRRAWRRVLGRSAVDTGGRMPGRALTFVGATVTTTLVCWAAPLYQQFTVHDGNLSRLVRWFGQDRPRVGFVRAVAITSQVVARFPLPLTRPDRFGGLSWMRLSPGAVDVVALGVVLGALAAVMIVRRRDDRPVAIAAGVMLVEVISTVLFVARMSANAFSEAYQLMWVWPIAVGTWIVLGWALLSWLLPWLDERAPVAATMAHKAAPLIVAPLIALAAIAMQSTYVIDIAGSRPAYRASVGTTVHRLDGRLGPYLVSCLAASKLSHCAAVTLALEANGTRTKQDPAATFLYGPDTTWRLAKRGERLPAIFVYSGSDPVPPVPGARLISGTVMRRAERHRMTALATSLRADPVIVRDADVPALLTAKARPLGGRLWLQVESRWFTGDTAAAWNALMASDPVRFVEGGGVAVLYEAGLLGDRRDLAVAGRQWLERQNMDIAWLVPEATVR